MDGPALQVGLGNVRAQCECCGSMYFVPAEPAEEITDLSDLFCVVCEAVTTYAALILQIADEGLKAARAHLQAGIEHVGVPWLFTARCPNGHFARQHGWNKDNLRTALRTGQPIRLYCVHCDTHWEATASQRGSIDFSATYL